LKKESKSTLLYTFLGVIVGYVSFWMTNSFETNLYQLVLAIVVLYVFTEILKRALKMKKEFKWFWSNGGWIYLFVWFITWVIFYNI